MELWFIYALLSIVGAGIFTFFFKVISQQKLDANYLTGLYFFCSVLIAGTIWIGTGYDITNWEKVLPLGALAGILFSSLYVIQIKAMDYIDTGIFFPLYKMLGPVIVIVVGLVWLGEHMSVWESIGVITSLLVALLLIDKKEKERQNNLPKGLLIVFVSALCAAVATLFQKGAVDIGTNIFLFIVIQNTCGFIANIIIAFTQKKKLPTGLGQKRYYIYAVILGALQVCFLTFSLKALELGSVSVVYTIMSLYIVIPIILSVLVYKEHMSIRKALAISLSVVAVVFFQI